MESAVKQVIQLAAVFVFFSCGARAQTQKITSNCAPVAAKNQQEALMMEGASDKNGCWSRDRNGHLVFLSEAPPSKNYNPLVTGPKGRRPKLPTPPSSGCGIPVAR